MFVDNQLQPNSHNNSPERTLSVEEKRQVIHAALLRYVPEAQPLRDRALDRVILIGLLGSSEQQPFRIGEIQRNLCLGGGAVEIRVVIVQQVIERLIEQEKVGHTLVAKRNAYYLKPDKNQDLTKAASDAANLFDTSLERLLKGTERDIPRETGLAICRGFICECFARFGKQIAKTVMGQLSPHDLMRSADARVAFAVAATGKGLSDWALELLESRCLSFLKSTNLEDETLKFYLTQGYYFTQLLGFEDGKFNPLAEQAFANSIFYLDTNTILPRLLPSSEKQSLFDEMSRVAKRLGIELRVTRATINEARRAAAIRIPEVNKILECVPELLAHRTSDQFLSTYLEAREKQADLTFEQFLEPFDRITSIFQNESDVFIDDREEADIVGDRDFSYAAEVIKRESENPWGRSKGQNVLAHDVSHYALVLDERLSNAKTWFLTNDRSLVQAAIKLSGEQQPFCFSFAGFLQSISPYLTSAEELSFADVFSELITEQVLPMEALYDTQELLVLADIQEDVQSTPPEQLVQACEYVKESVFQGHPIKQQDTPTFLLGLRKYLTSSADEQRRILELEAERQRKEKEEQREAALAERRLREAAESQQRQFREEYEREKSVRQTEQELHQETQKKSEHLENQIEGLKSTVIALESSEKNKLQLLEGIQSGNEREQYTRARTAMIVGIVASIICWLFGDVLILGLQRKWPTLLNWDQHLQSLISLLGFLCCTIPVARFTRTTTWTNEFKMGFLTIFIATAFCISKLMSDTASSMLSTYIEIAAAVAILFVYKRSNRNSNV